MIDIHTKLDVLRLCRKMNLLFCKINAWKKSSLGYWLIDTVVFYSFRHSCRCGLIVFLWKGVAYYDCLQYILLSTCLRDLILLFSVKPFLITKVGFVYLQITGKEHLLWCRSQHSFFFVFFSCFRFLFFFQFFLFFSSFSPTFQFLSLIFSLFFFILVHLAFAPFYFLYS